MRAVMSKTWSWHLYTLVAAICFYHLAVFQGPLIRYAIGADATGLQLFSLQVLQVCLLASLLLLVSMISVSVMKLFAIVLLITNAVALYFMHAYGIEIDITMINNILATNTGQATELWHWEIGLYMLVLGGIPALIILKTKVRAPKRIFRFLVSFGVFASFLAFAFATASTWLWYDSHSTRMGARILPWSYMVNTGRFYNKRAKANRVQILLPDATFLAAPSAEKEIVVLVLGEAARAANLRYYGYERDTNPFTAQTDMFALPIGKSCATYTIGSMACILTHEGREASARTVFEPLPSYLTRHGVHTIWHSNSGATPPFTANRRLRARELGELCEDADCPHPRLDGILFHNLDQVLLEAEPGRIFVALHQTGSHGPRYFQKYPPDLEPFSPVCRTVQMRDCSYEELVNAYDNTIHYTDFLLASLITQLESIPNSTAAVLYVSDHGQSLGENGLYLHGTPPVVAPAVQREIPFLVWMSDGFKATRGLGPQDVIPAQTFPHDFPFHSVMGAFGMRSDIYKPEYDIFSAANFD